MKKLYTIVTILTLLSFKSNAQIQFPFYGFELSNYDVGDTLEYTYYQFNQLNQYSECSITDLYSIVNKVLLAGNDSIGYTVHHVYNSQCYQQNEQTGTDSFQLIINNDTVYKNNNNLLNISLYAFDTSQSYDTAFVRLDTVKNLKRLRLVESDRVNFSSGYEAIQNIGLINMHYSSEAQGTLNWDRTLVYAHLANYGTFGTYYKLFDNTKQLSLSISEVYVYYDNAGNSFLSLSSTQNLPSPKLTIYDLLGREVITMPVNIGNNLINFNNYPKGMYLYEVTSNGNIAGQGKLMNFANN